MLTKVPIYLLIVLLVISCTTNKYATTNKLYNKQAKTYGKLLRQYPITDSTGLYNTFVGTTNFNMRKPNMVVIHHTAQNSCEQTLQTFTLTRTQVSAHYVICRTGKVHHMLNDYLRAWHAGTSNWGNITDVNSCSIGIELDNNGSEAFSEAQMKSLTTLLTTLKNNYNIPTANFVGHADIAPQRKNDPSRYFNWKQLATYGFGNWYDTTKVVVPPNYNTTHGLRLIGYNTTNLKAAIGAYKLHYNNTDTSKVLSPTDAKIIYSLAN